MGISYWEILSDAEVEVFEEMADRHDAAREADIDDMSIFFERTTPCLGCEDVCAECEPRLTGSFVAGSFLSLSDRKAS